MMMVRRTLLMAVLLGALCPAAASAQNDSTATAEAPPTQLVFEREVFSYPTFVRRNPFAPLSSNSAGGPRFDVISLRGIIYSAGPSGSVAMFGIGGGVQANPDNTLEVAAGQSRRLRVGEQWGNMRVLEIHSDRVVVEVTEFNLSETHVMRIVRAGQGGS